MTRVTFYDPYLHVLGGGEKYLLTILEEVTRHVDASVLVLSPQRPDPGDWRRLNVEVAADRLRWRRSDHLRATPLSAGADLFVTLTNHFPPLSLARRSAAIVQYPFAALRDGDGVLAGLRRAERGLRVRSYDTVLAYSSYVRQAITDRLEVASPVVINPPVDLPRDPLPERKAPVVLAVGRFFPAADANNKKHDVLIEAWRALQRTGCADGWSLHIAGGVHSDDASQEYLRGLRARAEHLAIQFHPNAPADRLRELYAEAALFWHAAGFGQTRPERHEHFGITTVEAMASGCIPVVVGLGGQREIVTDGVNGRLWDSLDDLVAITAELITGPAEVTTALRAAAERTALVYAKARFIDRIWAELLGPAGLRRG